jgi:hypothetical protein
MNVVTIAIIAVLLAVSGYLTVRQETGCDGCFSNACEECHVMQIEKLKEQKERENGEKKGRIDHRGNERYWG